MQGQIEFIPKNNQTYKILSAADNQKGFTLHQNTLQLVIHDYHRAPNQVFKIIQVDAKYLFVNPSSNAALRVDQENRGQGAILKADLGHFQSNFFALFPVTKGSLAGKAFHILTFSQGKVLDIRGGQVKSYNDICQWGYHGSPTQQWLILPTVQTQPQINPQQLQYPDVDPKFKPISSTIYRISPIAHRKKCLTVGYDQKIHLNTCKDDKSQRFNIHHDPQTNKYALISRLNNYRLYLYKDTVDNNVDVIAHPGNHVSNWFSIIRVEQGRWARKAYIIVTHAHDKCFDVRGGKFFQGDIIQQCRVTQSDNQLWVIEAVA